MVDYGIVAKWIEDDWMVVCNQRMIGSHGYSVIVPIGESTRRSVARIFVNVAFSSAA